MRYCSARKRPAELGHSVITQYVKCYGFVALQLTSFRCQLEVETVTADFQVRPRISSQANGSPATRGLHNIAKQDKLSQPPPWEDKVYVSSHPSRVQTMRYWRDPSSMFQICIHLNSLFFLPFRFGQPALPCPPGLTAFFLQLNFLLFLPIQWPSELSNTCSPTLPFLRVAKFVQDRNMTCLRVAPRSQYSKTYVKRLFQMTGSAWTIALIKLLTNHFWHIHSLHGHMLTCTIKRC